MRIGLAYSLAPSRSDPPEDGPDDRFEEFDRPETVAAIADVIQGEGHEVILLGDGREFLARVLADPPDFVFNIAEGEGVGRSREARVPAALEMLGIPYSGSDPLTLATCLDKTVTRALVAGSPCLSLPRGWSFRAGDRWIAADFFEDLYDPRSEYRRSLPSGDPPVFLLKPAYEGSSKGIRGRGLVRSVAAATAAFADLSRYEQPILVEEFIDGDEWTVGFVGNIGLVGAMRILPRDASGPFVYSLDVKRDWTNRVDYEVPPRVDQALERQVTDAAYWACRTLGCRDFARIDFRVRDGVPYFIEANPLPGLAPVSSDLVILAGGYGIGHADLIRRILHTALVRVGLA